METIMEHGKEGFYIVLGIFLFTIGITVMFKLIDSSYNSNKEVRDILTLKSGANDNINLSTEKVYESHALLAEIVSYNGPATIKVDGVILLRENISSNNMQYLLTYISMSSKYKKTYEYDSSGNIDTILYIRIT